MAVIEHVPIYTSLQRRSKTHVLDEGAEGVFYSYCGHVTTTTPDHLGNMKKVDCLACRKWYFHHKRRRARIMSQTQGESEVTTASSDIPQFE